MKNERLLHLQKVEVEYRELRAAKWNNHLYHTVANELKKLNPSQKTIPQELKEPFMQHCQEIAQSTWIVK